MSAGTAEHESVPRGWRDGPARRQAVETVAAVERAQQGVVALLRHGCEPLLLADALRRLTEATMAAERVTAAAEAAATAEIPFEAALRQGIAIGIGMCPVPVPQRSRSRRRADYLQPVADDGPVPAAGIRGLTANAVPRR